jgi:murein DD-endopeptidase MepM/ murein hydrolase activator NlpD
MLNKKLKCAIAAAMVGCVSLPFIYAYKQATALASVQLSSGIKIYNDQYDDAIAAAEAVKSEYEQKASDIQEQINTLSTEYDSILAYIQELDIKQNDLAAQITQITGKVEELTEEKEDTEKKLAEAEAKKEEQYEKMSARIQSVYENGETTYLDILLSSGSIFEILNRYEYVSEISEYDDKLFSDYTETVAEVKMYNERLEAQLASLQEVQDTYDTAMEYSEELEDAKNQALQECADKLGVSKELYAEYLVEIETQNMTIEQAKEAQEAAAKAAAEEAARIAAAQAAAQAKLTSTGSTTVSSVTLSNVSDLGGMIWPLPGYSSISSSFGPRTSPTAGASSYHKGIDIPAPVGTPIVAAIAGTVITSTYGSSEGNYVQIDHGNGVVTQYMHCSSLAVSVGQTVQQGQVIAYVGSTGVSTGAHLHFGVIINGTKYNPLQYVSY